MTDTLKDFVERADRLGIGYMLTGSFAMGLFVSARTTYDIDMIIELGQRDIMRFVAAFQPDYYVDQQSITRALEKRSMLTL